MNSNNNNWKQKALTPIVLKETDDSFSTVSDLMNAIEKDEILNIAVTGPYGSGKSSVIKTFKEMASSNIKILDISLATLDADASLLTTGNDDTERNSENDSLSSKISTEQKEILNRKIEFSILQQIVYRKTLGTLPFSRLKKIRHFSTHTIHTMAMYIVGAILLMAFALKVNFMQVPVFYEMLNIPVVMQNLISLICVVLLSVMMYETVVYIIKNYGGIRLQKISVGGNEIDIHDDGSIFNRHLDEILYFFQCTDYNVVVIEDLDRFNTTDIFLKLRELNHLINKSEMIGRTIKFIYAVKDDMFKDASRSKFFDYITTVIPVITTTNSKDMLKRALKEQGHDGEVADDDIRDIAFHIDDMRLLYNIVNEYHQYTQRLNKNGHHLEAKKMLAMMTVKNYFPHDFSELHNRRGRLYKVLSPQTKKTFVAIVVNKTLADKIKLAEEQLAAYDATCHLQEKELRLAYLVAIYEKLPNGTFAIIVDDTDYTLSQIADDAGLFEELISKDNIHYKYSNYYCNNKIDDQYIDFHNIEKAVNEQFTYRQRIEQLGKCKERLEADVQEALFEKQHVNTYTIKELIGLFNLYEEDCFKDIGLSEMEEDFVRQGYIAEDYNDYISYFYPDIMSLADHRLCMEMKLDRNPPFDSAIDNVELFLSELPETALQYKSVWNFYLIDHVILHFKYYKKVLNLIVESLILKESTKFLFLYCGHNEDGAKTIIGYCVNHDWDSMWNKFLLAKEEEQETLISMWFRNCEPRYIDEPKKKWMKEHYDFIATVYNKLSQNMKEFVTTKVYYKELTYTNPMMLKETVENSCYISNELNMPIVVEVLEAKDDIKKLYDEAEMELAIRLRLVTASWYNVNQYFLKTNKSIDGELIAWIESDIDILCDDENCKTDEYSDLFQALLELESWSDVVYGKLCKVNNWFVEESAGILKLSNSKLITLIQTGALDYSLDTLRKLQGIGATLSCEYILYYRKYITEMLVSGIMNTELAELLLYREGFSTLDYNEIMASFTPSSVTMNKSLANRICEYQSKQYSECDESILYDAISLCEDEHNAVLAVGHKIKQAGVDDSVINTLIERLPNAYNDLSKVSKHPKIIDTDYNRFLIQTLKDANYISSFTIRNGYIRVNTKKERRS